MSEQQKTDDINDEDKRRHPRFPLRAYADLQYSTKKWEAHVLDLSESGARLAILGEHMLQKGDPLRVHIELEEINLLTSPKKQLSLHGRLVHVREHLLGFEFQPDTPIDKTILYELLTQIENSQ
ncbi:MAG TPA: PilZ domain-containing protein [Cellvibrio sp.]|uniref:PilZ domain-containing protein n=1 Tax=Cellvibrio sp. TaxID=1965322 RepID=UPI000EBD2461|nr:PilZ domain-containing protein [Cellvibrio sp.]HCS65213.1 PilZ domain-containing protein [Cellvibrio sp.]